MIKLEVVRRIGEKKFYLYGGGVVYKKAPLDCNKECEYWIEYTPGLGEGVLREYHTGWGEGVLIGTPEYTERDVLPVELLVYQWSLIRSTPTWAKDGDIDHSKSWDAINIDLGKKYGFDKFDKYPRVSNFRTLKEFWQCQ